MDPREERLRTLLLRALEGDATAYSAFLRRRLMALPDDVEDLVQETLLAVHNQRLSTPGSKG